MIVNFVVSVFGAYYIENKEKFLDRIRKDICHVDIKSLKYWSDPQETANYYFANSDVIVVVLNARAPEMAGDIQNILDHMSEIKKQIIFVMNDEEKNRFQKEHQDLFNALMHAVACAENAEIFDSFEDCLNAIDEAVERKRKSVDENN